MKTGVTRAAIAGTGRNCGNPRSSFLFQPQAGEKSDQDPEKKEMYFTCSKTTFHVVRLIAF
jgi:hypothetical protein